MKINIEQILSDIIETEKFFNDIWEKLKSGEVDTKIGINMRYSLILIMFPTMTQMENTSHREWLKESEKIHLECKNNAEEERAKKINHFYFKYTLISRNVDRINSYGISLQSRMKNLEAEEIASGKRKQGIEHKRGGHSGEKESW